jgi:hypothetical protein
VFDTALESAVREDRVPPKLESRSVASLTLPIALVCSIISGAHLRRYCSNESVREVSLRCSISVKGKLNGQQ